MQTRKLGRSGIDVSVIGLGCNNFGSRIERPEAERVIDAALDHGITFFDTADIYADTRSEAIIGAALAGRRERVVLATKFGKPVAGSPARQRASRGYIFAAVEESLRRLRTDRIDFYWQHEPDPDTPIDETLGALEDLVRAGKIRAYGCSNFPAAEVEASDDRAKRLGVTGFVACQDEYSLVVRGVEDSLVPVIEARRMALVPYFPLAGGLLTGKYKPGADLPAGSRFEAWRGLGERYMTGTNLDKVEQLEAFAAERGRTILDLAFAWLLAHPFVPSVIAGATKPEQIAANAAAATWTLSHDEVAAVEAMTAMVA